MEAPLEALVEGLLATREAPWRRLGELARGLGRSVQGPSGGGLDSAASMESAYELFQAGTRLLEARDFHAAAVPLTRARDLEPDKTSIREALGRALFSAQRYGEAAEEFEAVVQRAPTNDFALFCLGRSLQQMGRHQEARHPLALACNLRPERRDYRVYRDRARRRAA